MEGYLQKKNGDRGFGSGWLTDKSKNWNRKWFVLEDQTVTYYEDFDNVTGEPVREEGKVLIKGCDVLPVSHKTKKYIFCVKDGNNTLLFLQAEDAKMLGIWMKALSGAANGDHLAPVLDYNLYYRRLRLDPLVEYEPSAINRAFRTLATYTSPENGGGNPKEFKELQEAFNHIMAQLNDREEERLYKLAFYEAIIIKGARGEGLGIVVQEEADRRNVVKAVKESLRIKSISGEIGEDGIQEGDQLMKIGSKDVSTMPLVRVAQRMNDFRIPPGAMVKLTFGRKVPREYTLNEYGEQIDLTYSQDEQDPQEQEQQEQREECYGEQQYDEVVEGQGAAMTFSAQASPEYTRIQEGPLTYSNPTSDRPSSSNYNQFAHHTVEGTGNEENGRAQSRQPPFSSGAAQEQREGNNSFSIRTTSPPPPLVQVPHYDSVSPLSSPGGGGGGGGASVSSPSARPMSLPVTAGRRQVSSRQSSYTPASPPLSSGSGMGMDMGVGMSGRSVSATRHGSIANTFSSPLSGNASLAPSVVTSPQSAARPLSAQMEAIHTKEYFYRNSLQMKSPAEIAEMKRDLDFCLKEMLVASKRIEDLEFHNAQLEDELSRYKALYADAAHHERLLETQLEQYLLHSTVTAEFMEESMNDMLSVSQQIAANVPIPVSGQTSDYLAQIGLGEDESEHDGSKASQRNAIAATAAMDRTGLMLQKWAMTGDSIMDKLCRFEERVQRMDSIHISSPEQGIPHHVMYTGPSPAAPQHQQSFRQGQNEDQGQREGQGTAVRQQSSFKQPQQYRHGNSTSPLRGTQSAFMSAAAAPPAPPAPPGGSSLKRGGGPASPNGTTSTPAGRNPTRASTDPQAAQLHRVNSQPVNGTTQPPLSPAGRAPLSRSATMSAGSGANYFPTQAPLADKLLAKSYSFKKF